jgi:hypothetical protein
MRVTHEEREKRDVRREIRERINLEMVMPRVVIIGAVLLAMVSTAAARAQQTTPNFGGAYAGLDERRQQLIGRSEASTASSRPSSRSIQRSA